MPENEKESIIGRAIMPRDMVIYKEDTIASRTLIMSREGTVTLFAFDEGQGLSEHTAPFDALAFALDGEAEISIAGTSHYLREGEMIIMPATIPHAVQPTTRFKMMLVMIHAGIQEKAGKTVNTGEKEREKEEKRARKEKKKEKKEKKKAEKRAKKEKKEKKEKKRAKKEKKKKKEKQQ